MNHDKVPLHKKVKYDPQLDKLFRFADNPDNLSDLEKLKDLEEQYYAQNPDKRRQSQSLSSAGASPSKKGHQKASKAQAFDRYGQPIDEVLSFDSEYERLLEEELNKANHALELKKRPTAKERNLEFMNDFNKVELAYETDLKLKKKEYARLKLKNEIEPKLNQKIDEQQLQIIVKKENYMNTIKVLKQYTKYLNTDISSVQVQNYDLQQKVHD